MAGPHDYRYRVVDVFTTQPLEGNQLGVLPDSFGLDGSPYKRDARPIHSLRKAIIGSMREARRAGA